MSLQRAVLFAAFAGRVQEFPIFSAASLLRNSERSLNPTDNFRSLVCQKTWQRKGSAIW